MSNSGSDKLKVVASLTNKIKMDDPCNIQFTSGIFSNVLFVHINELSIFQAQVSPKVSLCLIIILSTMPTRSDTGSATVTK